MDINSSRPPSQAHDINTIVFISISFTLRFLHTLSAFLAFHHFLVLARILTNLSISSIDLVKSRLGKPFHSLSSCILQQTWKNTTVRAYIQNTYYYCCCYFCSKRRPATHPPPPTRHGLGLGQLGNNTPSSATACATLVIADVPLCLFSGSRPVLPTAIQLSYNILLGAFPCQSHVFFYSFKNN